MAGLPPPPSKVVLPGGKLFGAVKLDHRAHLARRSPCDSCHSGRVGKIVQPAKAWHKACRGCHYDLARGPYECTGCHAKGRSKVEREKAPPRRSRS